jgi:hypothetical protein
MPIATGRGKGFASQWNRIFVVASYNCVVCNSTDRDDLFHAQAAPARGVGLGTRRAGQGKSGAGFYHSHRPRKQRTRASVKKPPAASEDNDERPPQASPSMQFRQKQMRDRNFADARATRSTQEAASDN